MRASTSRAAAPPAARRLSVASPRTGLTTARRPVLSQAAAAEELGFKEMRKGVKVRSCFLCFVFLYLAVPRRFEREEETEAAAAEATRCKGRRATFFATASAVAVFSPRHVECVPLNNLIPSLPGS